MTGARTGLPEIQVDELERMIRAGGVRVVDVREDWEFKRGRVPGAVHLPLGQLPARVGELPRDERLLIICEHGNRSMVATQYLLARGFAKVVSVGGGTTAWIRSGRPLDKD